MKKKETVIDSDIKEVKTEKVKLKKFKKLRLKKRKRN